MRKLVAVLLLLLSACDAGAQSVCAPRDALIKQLAKDYGELRLAYGLTNKGTLFEVLAAPDGTTWTMIITPARGHSCLMLSGDGWEALPQLTLPGRDS